MVWYFLANLILTFILIKLFRTGVFYSKVSNSEFQIKTKVRIEIGQELVNGEYFYYVEQNYVEDEINRVHSIKLTSPGLHTMQPAITFSYYLERSCILEKSTSV